MSDIEYVNLGPTEYERAKGILNKAKHPGFVGRELFFRCATSGVVCVAVIDGSDVGVAMVAKEKLQALSIVQAGQGKGVGTGLMARLQPKWVSSIEERVTFFERCGYERFGPPKVGQNGKHATQLMQRKEGFDPNAVTPDVTSRARVEAKLKKVSSEEVKARVWAIAQMMAAEQWNEERRQELISEWDVAYDTVNGYAAEAHRMLEFLTSDEKREQRARMIDARILSIGMQDEKDRVQALRLAAERNGLLVAKQEITSRVDGRVQIVELDELRRLLNTMGYDIVPLEAAKELENGKQET